MLQRNSIYPYVVFSSVVNVIDVIFVLHVTCIRDCRLNCKAVKFYTVFPAPAMSRIDICWQEMTVIDNFNTTKYLLIIEKGRQKKLFMGLVS